MRTMILILAIVTGACAAAPPTEGSAAQQTRCETCGSGDDGGDWVDPTSELAAPAVAPLGDLAARFINVSAPSCHTMWNAAGWDVSIACCIDATDEATGRPAGGCCYVRWNLTTRPGDIHAWCGRMSVF